MGRTCYAASWAAAKAAQAPGAWPRPSAPSAGSGLRIADYIVEAMRAADFRRREHGWPDDHRLCTYQDPGGGGCRGRLRHGASPPRSRDNDCIIHRAPEPAEATDPANVTANPTIDLPDELAGEARLAGLRLIQRMDV